MTDAPEPHIADVVPQPEKRGRWRFLRITRLLVWIVVLVWFARFAYVRWTTPPAVRAPHSTQNSGQEVRVQAVISAANSLPSYTRKNSGSPSWGGVAELVEAALEDWDPRLAMDPEGVEPYFAQPRAKSALDRAVSAIAALKLEDRLSGSGSSPTFVGASANLAALPGILACRARLTLAQTGDVSKAWPDLRAALVLQARLHFDEYGMYWVPWNVQQYPVFELLYEAQEYPLPIEIGREAIGILTERDQLDARTVIAAAVGFNGDVKALLDSHFTDDGHGNGWLVLSTMPAVYAPLWGSTAPLERSGFWNLFSPLFNDRRTVAQHLAGFDSRIDALADTPLPEIQAALQDGSFHTALTWLDGPAAFGDSVRYFGGDAAQLYFSDLQWRRAGVVIVALTLYRGEHGEYPAALSALTPDYLVAVPDDFRSAAPFVYARVAPDAFELGTSQESSPSYYDRPGFPLAGLEQWYNATRPEVKHE